MRTTYDWLTPAERAACDRRHALRLANAITRSARQLGITADDYMSQLGRREPTMRLSHSTLQQVREVM
jgi:hypothetical protein